MSSRASKIASHRKKVLYMEYARILFYLAVPAGIAAYYTDPDVMQRLIMHYQWIRHPPEDPRASAFLDGVMERRKQQTSTEKDFVEKELLETDFRKVREARLLREEKERQEIIANATKDLK